MFYLLSRLVSTIAGSVYPAYASYKAIKSNDAAKLELWLMFWVVMGTVMVLESTVEWTVAWFPFYYEIKTLAILWLTLPQIQGSTYVYVAHMHPFLTAHESEIDGAIADAKDRAKQAGLEWIGRVVQKARELVMGAAVAPTDAQGQPVQAGPQGPATSDASASTAGLVNLAGNYLRQYGPAAIAAGSKLLHPMNGRSPSVRDPATSGASQRQGQMRSLGLGHSPSDSNLATSVRASGASATLTRADARRRRAELEAELAALHSDAMSTSSAPSSSSASNRSVSSSAAPPPYSAQRSSHPRAVSAGAYPSSLSAGGFGGGPDQSRRAPSPAGSNTSGSATVDSNGVPRDPVAARIERSFVEGVGFEEIRRDEVGDFPPAVESRRLSTGVGNGSWWRWGASQQYSSVPDRDRRE